MSDLDKAKELIYNLISQGFIENLTEKNFDEILINLYNYIWGEWKMNLSWYLSYLIPVGIFVLFIFILFLLKRIGQRIKRKKSLKDLDAIDLSEFEQSIKTEQKKIKPQKQEEKEIVKKFKKEANSNEILKRNGIKVVNGKKDKFWRGFCVFCLMFIIVLSVFFIYLVEKDKFKNYYLDNSTIVCEQPEIPSCPSLECPEVSCDCVCPEVNVTINEYYTNSS